MNTSKTKAEELRLALLEKGETVLLSVISAAIDGKSINPTHHPDSQNKVWEAIIPILQNTAESKKIAAKTNADVLNLVSKGDITLAEAKEMVSLLALINSPELSGEDSNNTKKLIIEIATGGAT